MDGIINLLKPAGMTSHDVVKVVRRKFKNVKVGHTGTLDPMVEGVLPLCLGKATRITEYLISDNKKYSCEMTLGLETDTQDIWGEILEKKDIDLTNSEIIEATNSFKGQILQTPPLYSAVRVNGKRLYEYARKGQEVKVKPRYIYIYDIDILHIKENKVLFDVTCSKGTYIRTLCSDIGKKLGCGATMSALKRTASGRFQIEDAVTLEDIEVLSPEKYIFPMDYPLNHMGAIQIIDEDNYRKAINGCLLTSNAFKWKEEKVNKDVTRIYYNDQFIAIGEFNSENNSIKIKKVFV